MIIDAKGRHIQFDHPFRRIISLYGAHTENLYNLGCEDQLIGVSVNSTYPKEAALKPGFSYHDGPEKFIAAKPDLVLIRPMIDNGYPKLIKKLEKMGIAVASLQPGQISSMYDYWRALGILSGSQQKAQQMISRFKRQTKAVLALTQNINPKKKVYFQAIHSKMKTFTKDAMPIFVLETAGGINIAADAVASRNTNIAIYSKERILDKAAQIDVFLAQKGIMNPISKDIIINEPGFNIIKAIKENQVYLVDEDIVSRPVPRLIEGIIAIGTALYPEIFTKADIYEEH